MRAGAVIRAAEIGLGDSAGAEGGIKARAVGQVAEKPEVGASAGGVVNRTGQQDVAVGLNGQPDS